MYQCNVQDTNNRSWTRYKSWRFTI